MSVEKAKEELRKAAPPGWVPAKCCGTCDHWEGGYEGDGECNKYPDSYTIKNEYITPITEDGKEYYGSPTFVCDEWKRTPPIETGEGDASTKL